MKRTEIAAVYADGETLGGQEVTVCGWVRTVRDMKTFGFIELNDGSCFKNLQIVFEDGKLSNYKEIAKLNVGSAIIVRGTVKLTPEAKQPLEISADSIEVEGASAPDYPLQKEAPHSGISAHHCPSAPPYKPVFCGVPCAVCGGYGHARIFPGAGLCLCPHAHLSRPATARAPVRCSG